MKNIFKYIAVAVVGSGMLSCGDFLDQNATTQTYVNSIEDIQELILGDGYMPCQMYSEANLTGTCAVGAWIHVMDDDSKVHDNSATNQLWVNTLGTFHFWLSQPFVSSTTLAPYTDNTWTKLYQHINALNAIIYEMDNFKSARLYNQLKGEAHFLRALYYYFLVNLYGLPYNPATASTDAGVPVKLSELVEDKDYSRSSVAEVYKVIVDDLKLAIDYLQGVEQSSIYRVNQTAARTFLSRVYLYMCEWDLCVEQCNEALKSTYSLLDYRQLAPTDNKVFGNSPEVMFTCGDNRMLAVSRSNTSYSVNGGYSSNAYATATGFKASDELIALYDQEHDMRFQYFEYAYNKYKTAMEGYFVTFKLSLNYNQGDVVSDFFTLRLAEVYLNKAEALAMLGSHDSEAASTLQTLREKRMTQGYEVTETGEDLVNLIRDERRRELCFEGHRWFDLRRYAVSPKYPMRKDIYHGFDEDRDGLYDYYYKLPAYTDTGANNYMLPIPAEEIDKNHGALVDNPRLEPEQVSQIGNN